MSKVFVVSGSDHDYDYSNQWVVGVYSEEHLALEAINRDRAKYTGWLKPDEIRYDITDAIIDLDTDHDA